MLNLFARAHVSRVTEPVGRWLVARGVTPDAVTVAGTVGTAAAAVVHPRGQLFLGALLATVFVLFDMIDGAMARARGHSTPFGAVLDSTCDRIADGALFAAITWWCLASGQQALGVAALVCLVAGQVISYIKARAEGAGLTADGGLVERPERLIVALVGTASRGWASRSRWPRRCGCSRPASVWTVGQRIVAVHRSARDAAASVLAGGGTVDHAPGRLPAPAHRDPRPARGRRADRRRVRRGLARRPRPARAGRPRRLPARRGPRRPPRTAPGCAGCGRTCAGSSPTPRPDELDALVRAGLRSYARYWCEAFRLPAMDRAAVLARMDPHVTGMAPLFEALDAGPGRRRRRCRTAATGTSPGCGSSRRSAGSAAPARVHHGGRAAAPGVAVPPFRRLPGGARLRGARGGRRAEVYRTLTRGCATAAWSAWSPTATSARPASR